eukprot:Blabericola_migrator_1__8666@NODE_4551_length_1093_cov_151_796296_g2823_i0_p3_GENE_NODE_4551_length_1093_cov_151_796296_g2823_i0NODE_4551_length_1093_cov_151_796296_g2823_i0_p3_ORF_typecomplete_len113_score24_59_NODE_4551_length_1093_cov_151_796296_g2823_i07451083
MERETILAELSALGLNLKTLEAERDCSNQAFVGHWILSLSESDSCEEILRVCGISRIKRTWFKSMCPETTIEIEEVDENGSVKSDWDLSVLCSFAPLGHPNDGQVAIQDSRS